MIHIPGRLFNVNAVTANSVPRLFARNVWVIAIFDTEIEPMVLVLVGAIFVASIETFWHGKVTPPTASAERQGNGVRANKAFRASVQALLTFKFLTIL